MVYDTSRGVCVLHGGILAQGSYNILLQDTWEFDGTSWKPIGTSAPTARVYSGMAWDTARRRIVNFGGLTSATALHASDQTLELSGYLVPFGSACTGTNGAPALLAATPPRLGTSFKLELTNFSLTNGIGVIALGASNASWNAIPLPLNMTPLGATGCTLYTSLDHLFAVPSSGPGTASLNLVIPNVLWCYGVSVFEQGIALDPAANSAGFTLSNAGLLSIGQ